MNTNLAAIVCRHIAKDKVGVRHAARSEPIRMEDSGWQFLCGESHVDCAGASVWSIGEVIACCPEVAQFIDEHVGCSFEKCDSGKDTAEWRRM